jgi:hypothetical protein
LLDDGPARGRLGAFVEEVEEGLVSGRQPSGRQSRFIDGSCQDEPQQSWNREHGAPPVAQFGQMLFPLLDSTAALFLMLLVGCFQIQVPTANLELPHAESVFDWAAFVLSGDWRWINASRVERSIQ